MQYAKFKINSGDPATGNKLLTEITEKTPDYLPAWSADGRFLRLDRGAGVGRFCPIKHA